MATDWTKMLMWLSKEGSVDFTHFADIPVVDGHIHFPHTWLMDDVLTMMATTRIARVNLVGTPDVQTINQNPALIYFKAHHPDRVYTCGALDYAQVFADVSRAPETIAAQVATLKRIGFDGLKFVEGKPMVRKVIPLAFDGPEYAGLWAALEEMGLPVVFHVADPEEFWDEDLCPDWARDHGWFYGDGTYPSKEDLYAEVDRVLERHPGLRLILAHFYFLSADLARAGDFLDAHPNVCFDLTPGIEMYVNFARDLQTTRDFFVRYQDRLVYGTDIGASAALRDESQGLDMDDSLGRTWIVRSFLETDDVFDSPESMRHGLGMDVRDLHGIALPSDVLEKIYRTNFVRMFGSDPAPLNRDAAMIELERLAHEIDAQAGGEPVESLARQVARYLEEKGAAT
jgi:predicted TIM-barrel fold metal-dependent hydrolase